MLLLQHNRIQVHQREDHRTVSHQIQRNEQLRYLEYHAHNQGALMTSFMGL